MKRSIPKRPTPSTLLTALLLIGLLLRVLYIFQMRASPVFDWPAMDPGYHDEWARSIVAGKPITAGEPFFRAPLYPYFLAAVYRLGGGNPLHPRLVQAALGVLSLYLMYRIGRKLFGEGEALLAVFLALLYPAILYFEGDLLIEPLAIVLDLGLLLSLFLAEEKRQWPFWFLSGLLLGLSAITRPNILLFAPAIPLWLLLVGKEGWLRGAVVPALLVALAAAATIAPVTVRNVREGGDLVWIASQGGINFYLGNNPGADGWSATAPGIRKDWRGGIEDSYRIAKRDLGHDPKASEVSSYWYGRGKAFLRAEPGEAVRLFLKKGYLLFQGAEISNNYILDFATRYSPVYRALPLSFGVIVPLALVGIFCAYPGRRRALLLFFLGAYSVSIVLFFVCSRYRIPLVHVLLLYAAAGVFEIGARIRRRRRSAVPVVAGLFGLLYLLNHDFGAIAPLDWTLGYLGEGVSYLERGDPETAAARFRDALRLTPESSEAEHDLGVALRQMGDLDGAIGSFRRSLALNPRNPEAYNNLALTLSAAGRTEEALASYRQGIALDPANAGLHVNLAQLFQQTGRYEEAIGEYKAALASGARDGRVNANLGVSLVRTGHPDEGEAELRKGVELTPGVPGPSLLLAEHLVSTGRAEEARAVLEAAEARMPGEREIGEALRGLDRPAGP